ncbi:putative acetyl-CoA synthetase-like protein [Rhizoctonia solani 123E]|uniref:Putative acetyl-CoA synthetase-like protein n=1 Tax=Rhizoctonia solani 123E TaxID=1423351 RepID=A0A074RMG8_9AGAM|nr:putative acetyl-CoA synthetase-like protein [Rhizoctonia solani 123E]
MIATSTDFVYPPTDGSVPPASAVDFHLKYNSTRLFAILHDVNDSSQTNITYEQLAHAVHRAAYMLNPGGNLPQGTNIGFLVSTHTIEYIVMILGAMRAGLVPFPISPRTHIPGIAHLLKSTQTSLVVAGGSQTIESIVSQLTRNLVEIDFSAQFVDLPTLESVLPELNKLESHFEYTPFPPLKPMTDDAIVNILHSSGSTGMPRPVKFHLEGVFKNIVTQPLGWMYAQDGVRVGTMALPTFHAMGLFLQIIIPLYVGYTQVLFAPSHIPVVPTSNLTIEAAASTKCSHMICVPAFLEMWSQEEAAVAYLRQMKGITFGGGPLAEAIGNKLVDQGVHIHSCYGATEFGGVNEVSDLDDLSDWSYVKFSSHVDARFIPQNDEDHSFELVFVVSGDHKPFELNFEVDGKPAYRTKDLVVRHPCKPDLWKFVGRLDEQIILLNGEKTNPGPMEGEIVKCPIVHYAVMFGRERNQTGVLIELEESASTLYQTKEGRAKAMEQIWPFIERANQTSPSHSRLDKQTVIIVDPARSLPRTPKGTVPRSAALKLYAHDIEEMYLELEKDTSAVEGVEPPQSWTSTKDVEDWISKSVQSLLGREVDVTGDLFQQGMDSLTATMLLRILKSSLHASSDPNVQSAATKINQQTIFGKPTVRQLAQLLVQLSENDDASVDPVAEALQNILAMIQKYDSDWPRQEARSVRPVQKERVVVTGTTGGLGSHLLAQLLESDRVEKVWAMNRKSSKGNREREVASFEDKQLDVSLLKSKKLVFMDTDLEDPKLGLRDEAYDEIRNEATIIIHNAWQVNFNLSLQSFEPSIRGARNLLDLAFHSTAPTGLPRFAFASSISVAGFAGPGRQLSEVSVTPEMAATSIGYGQSKLVTEKLLESARNAGLQTCTVRLGQLTGDLKSGAWTTTDWVPSLISSSVSVGCIPGAVGTVSWLPLDVAAHSIIDTCIVRNKELPRVIHTSHPRPVPWMDIMNAFSQSLAPRTGSQLPIVRFDEWNKCVVEAAASFKGSESDRYKRFPSTKIQSTVDGMVLADDELRSREHIGNVEAGGTVQLDTTVAAEFSETFKSTAELGKEHVQKWVGYWEAKGLFA